MLERKAKVESQTGREWYILFGRKQWADVYYLSLSSGQDILDFAVIILYKENVQIRCKLFFHSITLKRYAVMPEEPSTKKKKDCNYNSAKEPNSDKCIKHKFSSCMKSDIKN